MSRNRHVDNMVGYMEKLSDSDITYILAALRVHGQLGTEIHEGLLPFVSREAVTKSVTKLMDDSNIKKKGVNILDKLGVKSDASVSFLIRLDDKKVRRYAKGDSDNFLVLQLQAKTKANAGMQWQEFGKKWISPEVNVNHNVSLTKTHMKNTWRVSCKAAIEDMVKQELFNRFPAGLLD